jgi:hypothetical protein
MKKRDDQITLRISGELRTALEAEATADKRDLSSMVRAILISHVAQCIVAGETAAKEQHHGH